MSMFIRCLAVALCSWAGIQGHLRAQAVETIYDEDVKLVSFEDLAYPAAARLARVQGVVVVEVLLEEDGSVRSVMALAGARVLIPDVLENAKKWRFKPTPRLSAMIVYDFRIDDGACHDKLRSVFLLKHANFASIVSCNDVIEG